jgi:nitrogen fixation/metabolism regulation signal transduction histidine kinase
MTRQLAEAREQTEKSRTDLEAAKAYLESVLANMSAGVLVLDHAFKLVSCNESVDRILFQDVKSHVGQALSDIHGMGGFHSAIVEAFSELSAKTAANGSADWQRQIEFARMIHVDEEVHDLMLLARGSRLSVEGESGYIVVFDDVTDIISAQRSLAWGEVARRLAHEIKNPLTPIQLSAERLQMKLESKLTPDDTQFLEKSIHTIVGQVVAMKRMVDDFSNYAKTAAAQLVPLDLNNLIKDIVHLYVGDSERDNIHMNLYVDLPWIMGDETQLRQVIHNLLQNSLDSVAEADFGGEKIPFIEVITEKVTYHNAANEICVAVRLSVVDNGKGFQQKMLSQVFEPYATTKERGTGIGMAVVKKIIDEHSGQIDVRNRQNTHGAIVSILFLQLAP